LANPNRSKAACSFITDDNQASSERILCYNDKSYTTDEVHKGSATIDWQKQEKDRGTIITLATMTCR
jgi:translation elongation factor EF-G